MDGGFGGGNNNGSGLLDNSLFGGGLINTNINAIGGGGGGGGTVAAATNNHSSLIGGLLEDLSLSSGEVRRVRWRTSERRRSNNCILFQAMPAMTALDKNGLTVIMTPRKGNGCLNIVMTASNNSLNTLDQFLFQVLRTRTEDEEESSCELTIIVHFQAAVPKSFQLQMLSPSGSTLPPGGVITQEMRVTNSAKVRNWEMFYLLFCSFLYFLVQGCVTNEIADLVPAARQRSGAGANGSEWVQRGCIRIEGLGGWPAFEGACVINYAIHKLITIKEKK